MALLWKGGGFFGGFVLLQIANVLCLVELYHSLFVSELSTPSPGGRASMATTTARA
jgi:hypothetical protein